MIVAEAGGMPSEIKVAMIFFEFISCEQYITVILTKGSLKREQYRMIVIY